MAAAIRSSARIAAGEAPPVFASTIARPLATAASQASPRSGSGPVHGDLAVEDGGRPEQRLLEEVGALEDRVGQPEGVGVGALERLAVVERVLEDQLHRGLGTDQVRHQPGAAPAGHQAEHHLGQAEGRRRVADGAVGAVQRHLEATAEGEAVDEAERRLAALAELAEDRVPELGDDAYAVRAAAGDRGQVGPGGQDERLAGHAERGDLVVRERGVDGRVQRQQAARAERVRLGVVLAVVQRDQPEGPGAAGQGDLAEVGVGDPLGVGGDLLGAGQQLLHGQDVDAHQATSPVFSAPVQCGFSQITVPPMPMPTHMVVRP